MGRLDGNHAAFSVTGHRADETAVQMPIDMAATDHLSRKTGWAPYRTKACVTSSHEIAALVALKKKNQSAFTADKLSV